jgi:hypothetical protein
MVIDLHGCVSQNEVCYQIKYNEVCVVLRRYIGITVLEPSVRYDAGQVK